MGDNPIGWPGGGAGRRRLIGKCPSRLWLTDARAGPVLFRGGLRGYGNWELSSDRAQSARRALVENGLSSDRIESVAGRASKDPLVPDDPTSARNRRISIMLLREVPPPGAKPRAKAVSRSAKPARLEQDWTGPRVR